jgi:hypothetical protein
MATQEKEFKFDKLKIDKNLLMSDLKELIYKNFNIPKELEIFLIKKIDLGVNNPQITELFSNEDDMTKQINMNVHDNVKLYLEIKLHEMERNQSLFLKYFDENSANVIVNFNIPVKLDNIIEAGPTSNATGNKTKLKPSTRMRMGLYKFDNQIEIKKNKTLGDLKKRISEVLNLSQEEFIMKKKSHNGIELKNLSEIVDKHSNTSLDIYIEYGNPQKDTEIKINLYRTEYDFSFFLVFPYKTIDEGIFKIDLHWSILELKKYLINELQKKGIVNFNKTEEVYIREYKNDRPTKFYSDISIIGKDLQFTESKKIIIQKYKQTDLSNDNFNDVQLSIRLWDPSVWKISAPYEIHFQKGTSFLEFAEKIYPIFKNVEEQNMSVYKIVNDINLYMDDFKKFKVIFKYYV